MTPATGGMNPPSTPAAAAMGNPPSSPAAAREALLRARWIAETVPMGPVYVNLDAEMQEAALAEPVAPLDAARFAPVAASAPTAESVAQAAALLKNAKSPVMLIGRASRSLEGWNARVRLAEAIGARVITDLKRVSKPGRRIYWRKDRSQRVPMLGVAILSTSQGVLTSRSAQERGIGGEVICYVW